MIDTQKHKEHEAYAIIIRDPLLEARHLDEGSKLKDYRFEYSEKSFSENNSSTTPIIYRLKLRVMV